MVYTPAGMAHGFYVTSEKVLVLRNKGFTSIGHLLKFIFCFLNILESLENKKPLESYKVQEVFMDIKLSL